ncbi:hypothetical protein [Microcystis phage Mwe-JY26]
MSLALRLAQPDVASLPDWQAANVLNTPNSANGTITRDVPCLDIYSTLLVSGEWGRIELYSRLLPTGTLASPSGQDADVARLVTFVRAVQTLQSLPTSRSSVASTFGSILNALEAAGFISPTTRTTLVGLATRDRSWAEANGFPNGVTARDVSLARGGRA